MKGSLSEKTANKIYIVSSYKLKLERHIGNEEAHINAVVRETIPHLKEYIRWNMME